MKNQKGFIELFLLGALIAMLLVSLYFILSHVCTKKSVSFEDHYFGFFEGCMVLHKERFLPLENIRGFD